MRYIVKDLGLLSDTFNMAAAGTDLGKGHVQMLARGHWMPTSEGALNSDAPIEVHVQPEVALKKHMCAVCEVVGATRFCSKCKVPRYCSVECQIIHLKAGGRWRECFERK